MPVVKRKTEICPQECPQCGVEIFQRWGKFRKPVRDNRYAVCQFHVRRRVGRSLDKLRETAPRKWLWVLEEISDLLANWPLKPFAA